MTSDELLDLGIGLMDEARQLPDRPRTLAQFRDGLLIAFCRSFSVRLSNLASLIIGDTLVRTGEGWIVSFPPEATKTHRALQYRWPEFLVYHLEEYIGRLSGEGFFCGMAAGTATPAKAYGSRSMTDPQ